jgi:flagellar protein FlaG
MVDQVARNETLAGVFPQAGARPAFEKPAMDAKVVEAEAPKKLSPEEMQEVIDVANAALKNANNSLQFQIDESLEQPIVSVVDQDSGEVIRQLPSEEIVRISRSIDSMRGVLFDTLS